MLVWVYLLFEQLCLSKTDVVRVFKSPVPER